jgi:hypothetical protein
MVIFQGTHRFELTVEEDEGVWTAQLKEFVPDRLMPTLHLLRTFGTRQEAIEALTRRWRILFPDDAPLVWREPTIIPPRSQPRRPRPPTS